MDPPPPPADNRSHPYFYSAPSGTPISPSTPGSVYHSPVSQISPSSHNVSPPIPAPYGTARAYNPTVVKRRTLPPPPLPPRRSVSQVQSPISRTSFPQPQQTVQVHEIDSSATATTHEIATLTKTLASTILGEVVSQISSQTQPPQMVPVHPSSPPPLQHEYRPVSFQAGQIQHINSQHGNVPATQQYDPNHFTSNPIVSSPSTSVQPSSPSSQPAPPSWDVPGFPLHDRNESYSHFAPIPRTQYPNPNYSVSQSAAVVAPLENPQHVINSTSQYQQLGTGNGSLLPTWQPLPSEGGPTVTAGTYMPTIPTPNTTSPPVPEEQNGEIEEVRLDPSGRLIFVTKSGSTTTSNLLTESVPSPAYPTSQTASPPPVPKKPLLSGLFSGKRQAETGMIKRTYKLDNVPLRSAPGTPLRTCTDKNTISYPAVWYFHSTAPDFLICSYCYATEIAPTRFATEFKSEMKTEEAPRSCRFYVQRMKDILWRQAVSTGDLNPVVAFMQRRSQIKNCLGTKKTNSSAAIKYYSHKNKEPVDGFIACEACYEDFIMAKPFAHDFEPCPSVQAADSYWACDAALSPVWRALQNHNDWDSWVEAARLGVKRLNLGDCPASRVGDTTRVQWYTTKKGIKGLSICEPCYFETIVNTEFTDQFEFLAGIWQTGWGCDFQCWSIKFAYYGAVLKQNYNIFWDTTNKIMNSPFCAKEGMKSDVWYTLGPEPGLRDFSVCPACYYGIFCSVDTGHHFIQQTFRNDEEKPTGCSMWRDSPRGLMYLRKWGEAVDTQNFYLFTDLVTAVCSTMSCPRDTQWKGRQWYGYPEALFCGECYALHVKDTSLAQQGKLKLINEVVAEERICSMYSPRMRGKWAEVCSSGNVQPFLDYAKHREDVFRRTMPEVRMLIEMMQMRQMMSMSMGMMAMMTHAGDSINNMAGDTSESWSITTSDGFHGSGGSELGAQRQADFERSMSQASSMGSVAKGNFLESLWRQVE